MPRSPRSKTAKLFPEQLRALRKSAGLSVQGLAEKAGLTRQQVYRLERGEDRPSWETVCRLADALETGTEIFREKA